ncbi:MAG: hypothetical protein M3486_04905 [Actinomycetota bacterium]|nr:hypothetical protein [Actinomycetota bacterium]
MFRDSKGVVHTVSSADPLSDLPPGAATALQRALLTPPDDGESVDVGGVLERCDAVRELVERWQDAFFAALPDEVDLEEEARWAAEAGLSLDEVEAGYEDDEDDDEPFALAGLDDEEDLGELDVLMESDGLVEDDEDPRALLPQDLVAVLERELLLLPVRVRLEALVAAADLVATWADLVADQEKLLGHLVLAHDEPQTATEHEAMAGRHAVLHGSAGPGHAEGGSLQP